MQVLEGMTEKVQKSTIEKYSVQVADAFLSCFGCPTVKKADFVLVSHVLLNDDSFSV